ncbi:MAG: vitamin B12 dependent-methionine synthase activation domain-containing protein, partial [Planctomycetaceae bacterium]
TAVKIAPKYEQAVVHVLDASRSVPVVENLIDQDRTDAFLSQVREKQQTERSNYDRRQHKAVSHKAYSEALENRFQTDWSTARIDKPSFRGLRVLKDHPLDDIVPFIDWSPFFMVWELKGKYPKIFNDPHVGGEARKVFDDAQKLLSDIVAQRLLTARAVYGFWPANCEDDDVVLYAPNSESLIPKSEIARFPMLRQQWERKGQAEFRSLSDYIAPVQSGRTDYIGAFAVTTGHGCNELVAEFEARHDDYHSIMTKALADRLAEAFAERLHQRAREEWGYGKEERLSNDDLISEKYRGIRPAFGYPACPDHTRKRDLFDLLHAEENAGITLTESFAMLPAASVSGLTSHTRKHGTSQYGVSCRIR